MNVLFVSKERPGRFGPLARELAKAPGWRCEFLCENIEEPLEGVSLIQYEREGSSRKAPHFLTRHFDLQMRHAEAIYDTARSSCRQTPQIVVDTTGTGCSASLRDLFGCPVVTHFEYFHPSGGSAGSLRLRPQVTEEGRLRWNTLNAAHLLDLVNCDCGVTSTQFQHSLIPKEFGYKVRVLFEGCDTRLFSRRKGAERSIGRRKVEPGTRIVTYLASRLDDSQGFDTFTEAAEEIERRYPDVLFVICGSDVRAPGEPAESVKERFLRKRKAASSKFVFIDRLPDRALAGLFSITDLMLHFTVPAGISPHLISAMSSECVVLGSDTAPVREFIRHRQNGLLAGFSSAAAFADEAVRVLKSPADYRSLGKQARAFVAGHLSLKATLPKFQRLLREAGERLPDQFAEEAVTAEMQEDGGADGSS